MALGGPYSSSPHRRSARCRSARRDRANAPPSTVRAELFRLSAGKMKTRARAHTPAVAANARLHRPAGRVCSRGRRLLDHPDFAAAAFFVTFAILCVAFGMGAYYYGALLT